MGASRASRSGLSRDFGTAALVHALGGSGPSRRAPPRSAVARSRGRPYPLREDFQPRRVSSVFLPEPEGPIRTVKLPRAMVRSMSMSACLRASALESAVELARGTGTLQRIAPACLAAAEAALQSGNFDRAQAQAREAHVR